MTASREVDVVGRFGGEEFLIVLPATGERDARVCAERIRAAVAELQVDTDDGAVEITTSVGVASARSDEAVQALLARADAALYAAKAAGRDRVEVG